MLKLVNKLMAKIRNLKLVIMLKYQNIKILLQKVALQIGLREFLWLKKVINTVPWTYDINNLIWEEIFERLNEKKSQKTNQKEFRTEEQLKNVDNYMLNGKDAIIWWKRHSINE